MKAIVGTLVVLLVAPLLLVAATARDARADATTDVAAWLDVPMIGDYAVMYGDQWQMSTRSERSVQNISQRWRALSVVVRFFSNPENINDDRGIYEVAAMTLGPEDRSAIAQQFRDATRYELFSGINSSLAFQGLSEFDRRNLGQVLRTQYLERMMARIPTEPVRIVELQQYQLGEFDFEAQEFPYLQSGVTRPARLDTQPFLSLSVETVVSASPVGVDSQLPEIPPALSVPVASAEAFADMLGTEYPGRRAVFVAHLGELVGYERRDGVLVARVDSVAAALYTDPELTNGILAFDIPERVDPAAAQEAAEAEARAAAAAAEAAALAEAQEAERRASEALAAAQVQVGTLDLAILGVRLGMTEAEARAALVETQAAFEGGLYATDTRMERLTTGNGCTMPDLRILRREFEDRSRGLSQDEIVALEAELIATLPLGCQPESNPLGASFPGIAELQGGRITDAVRVYLGSTNRVIAVARQINTDGRDLGIREGAIARYGEPNVTATRGGVVYWSASAPTLARAQANPEFSQACFPGRHAVDVSVANLGGGTQGVAIVRLGAGSFELDCGQFLGADFSDYASIFFLVDTTRLTQVREEVEMGVEAEEEELEAEIKF